MNLAVIGAVVVIVLGVIWVIRMGQKNPQDQDFIVAVIKGIRGGKG